MALYAKDLDGYYIQNGILWNPALISSVVNRFNDKFDFQQKISAPASRVTADVDVTIVSLSDGTRLLMDDDARIYDKSLKLVGAKDLRIGMRLATAQTTGLQTAGIRDGRPNGSENTSTDIVHSFDTNLPIAFMAAFIIAPETTSKSVLQNRLRASLTMNYGKSLDEELEESRTFVRPVADVSNVVQRIDVNLLTIERDNNPGNDGFFQNIAQNPARGIDYRRIIGHDFYPITDPASKSSRNYIVAYNMGLYAGSHRVTRAIDLARANESYLLPQLTRFDNKVRLAPYNLLNERGTVLSRTPLLDPNEALHIKLAFLSGFIDANGELSNSKVLTLRFHDKRDMLDIINILDSIGINVLRSYWSRYGSTTLQLSGANTIHFQPYEITIEPRQLLALNSHTYFNSKLLTGFNTIGAIPVAENQTEVITVTDVIRNVNINSLSGNTYRLDLARNQDGSFLFQSNNVLLRFNKMPMTPEVYIDNNGGSSLGS